MSSSITIPTGRNANKAAATTASPSSSSSYSSSPTASQQSPSSSSTSTSSKPRYGHDRRRSLLSTALAKEEHTTINIGDPDGTPRLITCVRSSQGFDWNPEIFLPSYMESDFESFERKREPVHEIRLSDEEIKQMFPQ
ncbi:hypothetical protein SBOR_9265 [Sclerotinia borealis F-4128]|uniref:Uncharacterized protein n=1 Tax=Sclerotinia borealis (strain F-4128) TaxID=1432307 RepID=W9C3B3_SCLBF|nr:hypothetical protein SBOR_9265 [Sclerotinia borealis F-4128]